MIIPDLAKRIAWYQERLRPEDERHGVGISDWTITSEWIDGLESNGDPIWGMMCSPSALPAEYRKLQPIDIAAKRAHIAIRTPTSEADLAEVDRTIIHELGHVLVAPLNLPRDSEEEIMHSLDHLFSKLTPEEGIVLARAIRDPMARAYRAPDKEGSMPDTTQTEEKPKEPMSQDMPEGEKKPMAQVRSVAEIEADLIKAVLAGQPTDEIAAELVAAKAMAETQGPASEPAAAPEVPAMGMKPEEQAYQRKIAEERKEAIEAIVDANPHLTDPQKAMVRAQGSAKAARALVATYPRTSVPEKPTMGMKGHPATGAGGGKHQSPMARACALPSDPMVRKTMGYVDTEEDTGGVSIDVPGNLIVMDLHKRAAEAKARSKAQLQKARGVA